MTLGACSGCTSQSQQPGALGVGTISLSAHTGLFEVLASSLEKDGQVILAASDVAAARLLATPGLITQVHSVPEDIVPGGGVLVTAATSTGSQGVVKAVGSIASIYHASTMRFFVDQQARAVRVQLSTEQPIQLDYTWHFAFRDVVTLPDGRFMASSVVLDAPMMAAAPPIGAALSCLATCGAVGIASALGGCLLALIGGPEAYVACVVAVSGASISTILCGFRCQQTGSPVPVIGGPHRGPGGDPR